MEYGLLIVGFAILIMAGDVLVRGSTSLALHLGIPPIVVGLTIVACGTSAPELVVSIRAVLSDAPGIAIGNVVGSNIANVLLVLGLPALIKATDCCEPSVRQNTMYMIGATMVFIALCFYGPLQFWHGAVLFVLMIVFLLNAARGAARASTKNGSTGSLIDVDVEEGMNTSWGLAALFIAIGVIGLPIGAHLVVTNASLIAASFGVSDAVIGLTMVALGTSLPELATTIMAAWRGHTGIAIGNVIGSNLFNLLAIMGLTAMVAPVPIPREILEVDLWIMLGAALIIVPFALGGRSISRAPALAFVAAYIAYIAFVFHTGQGATATAAQGASANANMSSPLLATGDE